MSLYCGQGREPIESRFFFIYSIGTLEEGLKFPISKEPEEYCPDCAVCSKHFSKVSKNKLLSTPDTIEGRIYAVASGASTQIISGPGKGNVCASDSWHNTDYKFLDEQTMKINLPGALEILTAERLGREFPRKDLGLNRGRVVYDTKTGLSLFFLEWVSLKDRTKYVVIPIDEKGNFKMLNREQINMVQIAKGVESGKLGVHTKDKSNEIFEEDYRRAMSGFTIMAPERN